MKLMTRKEKEDAEIALLNLGYISKLYTLSSQSQGRLQKERESSWRTLFERDVDRIIHCWAYRRLRNKTQVVLLPTDQHLTTRLTHTQDVNQVARRICSILGLNIVLAEAIALGHDLGHTPFGHAGEAVLQDKIIEYTGNPDYVFHHAKYGLDIVDRIEKDGRGLNLTVETRDGIENHSLGSYSADKKKTWPMTPEGRVVVWSDKIAYLCSDLDDALRVGIITESQIPQPELRLLGPRKSKWIGSLNRAVIESSLAAGDIAFEGEYREAFDVVKQFMYDNVYGAGRMTEEFDKAKNLVDLVFDHVMDAKYGDLDQEDAAFEALDDVACMTDQSILRYFKDEFIPVSPY